ncbi:hypothetical protein GCM10010307_57690 [Streptomyces vastus]|uniref:Uncharacterized protein n=1 Tax=Streptomyces vastus TaxID=285451 RepID=A0ABP6DNM1_9ACTN
MDHTQAPVLEALRRHHERGELAFTPPGHKQARGADPQARAILGDAVYHTDLLASGASTTGVREVMCCCVPSG